MIRDVHVALYELLLPGKLASERRVYMCQVFLLIFRGIPLYRSGMLSPIYTYACHPKYMISLRNLLTDMFDYFPSVLSTDLFAPLRIEHQLQFMNLCSGA
jgi:hypothetical protein